MAFQWNCEGARSVVLCTTAATDFERWYSQLCRWVSSLDGWSGIALANRQYELDRGRFVTTGAPARYGGRDFSIWSDGPGEIVLVHDDLRAGAAEALCRALATAWEQFDGVGPEPATAQAAVCSEHAVSPCVPAEQQKLGIALHTLHLEPLNGLRIREAALTSGWYLWGGVEMSSDPDFFDPLHHAHVVERCPIAMPFLALPPGWRFLVAPGQIDVWNDEGLLRD